MKNKQSKDKVKTFFSHSNIDYRKYYDSYHFIFNKKRNLSLDFLNLTSLYQYPKIKKALITINSWECNESRKNIQSSNGITSPESLLVMKSLLKILWGKPDYILKKEVFEKNQEVVNVQNGYEVSFYLHEKEDLYSLFDLLYFELEFIKRYSTNNIKLSGLNKNNLQTINVNFSLNELSKTKNFEDFLGLDFNVNFISVNIQFTIEGDINILN